MFFTPELLAKRESGFGLLWLAATLGSQSAFKKLPKRSVLSANISQLCGLIVEPHEPLALRLSSNLMIGVTRLYKVKQDMFMVDVSSCATSLKKMISELHTSPANDRSLQMAHPSAKAAALTLTADPKGLMVVDFDAFVADWDDFLNINEPVVDTAADDEYDPKARTKTSRPKEKHSLISTTENARAAAHTLTEHHDHVLSASFDLSFSGALDPSSSHLDGNLPFEGFEDNIFPEFDGLDIAEGLGDDFVRELGEDWGAPTQLSADAMDVNPPPFFDTEVPMTPRELTPMDVPFRALSQDGIQPQPQTHQVGSPPTSFSALFLSQTADEVQPEHQSDQVSQEVMVVKTKKPRILLDPRIELTDAELKAARATYTEAQNTRRVELEQKKTEKLRGIMVEEIFWSAPNGIQAPSLMDFWLENFKVQIEGRIGDYIETHDRPRKRRRTSPFHDVTNHLETPINSIHQNDDYVMDGLADDFNFQTQGGDDERRQRSSEEPGQGRYASRAPSIIGHGQFGKEKAQNNDIHDDEPQASFHSPFPWDNAAASSSMGLPFRSDTGRTSDLGRNSFNRRGSSLIPSRAGSATNDRGLSPAIVCEGDDVLGEDFAFPIGDGGRRNQESQLSELNLLTLEKHSFNFLEL